MFNGRIDRTAYILGAVYSIVPIIGVIMGYAIINYLFSSSVDGSDAFRRSVNISLFLVGIVYIVLIIPVSVGLSVRRWHDSNQSGWLYLLNYVPLLGSFISLAQMVIPGTEGPNSFGTARSPRKFIEVLFGQNQAVQLPPTQSPPVQQPPLQTTVVGPIDTPVVAPQPYTTAVAAAQPAVLPQPPVQPSTLPQQSPADGQPDIK